MKISIQAKNVCNDYQSINLFIHNLKLFCVGKNIGCSNYSSLNLGDLLANTFETLTWAQILSKKLLINCYMLQYKPFIFKSCVLKNSYQ